MPRSAVLAAHWRARFALPVIVIVGSNGKTTVKEMLAAILRAHFGAAHVLATEGNLNNAIGLPLTILASARRRMRAAAIELGMNHPGETAELAAIAQPTIAIINNAQREHQEFMRSVADVAEEHAAIVRALPADGIVVLNADDPHVDVWRAAARERAGVRVVEFALDAPAAIRLLDVRPIGRRRAAIAASRHPAGDATARLAALGPSQRVERARGGGRGARDRRSARQRSCAGSRRFVRSRGRLVALTSTRRRRRDRRHLQRESGFGGRGDRRARRGAGAALARAGRHGRSRRERAALSTTRSARTRAPPASTGC